VAKITAKAGQILAQEPWSGGAGELASCEMPEEQHSTLLGASCIFKEHFMNS